MKGSGEREQICESGRIPREESRLLSFCMEEKTKNPQNFSINSAN